MGGRARSRREQLADMLLRRLPEIESRWLATVQRQLRSARKVELVQLRNAMPDYLARLAEAVRSDSDGRGAAAWEEVAAEHGVARVRLGFDVSELVNEFILLRQILTAVAREEELDELADDLVDLVDLVEAAIAISVSSYVESRDFEARRREAEHIGFITHELRNPLTGAMLAASQIAAHSELPDGRLQRPVVLLERSLRRQQELIDGVLLAERLEAGAVRPRAVEVQLHDVIGDALALTRARAEEKGLEVRVRYRADLQLRVDPGLTMSAISNLLDNAVKYTERGWILFEVEEQGDTIVAHVRDSCGGLSNEELGTIFEPFHRGGGRRAGGTGLGLTIARRAVEAQGGALHAESVGERGCHFWFTLPRQLPLEQVDQAPSP